MNLNDVAKLGRKGDNRLLHISDEEYRALAQMNGGPLSVNPRTGLHEAFSLKSILKVAAPIAGAVLGGPLGAAAGISAAAGSALGAGAGSLLAGSKPKDALLSAGLSLLSSSVFGSSGSDVRKGATWGEGTVDISPNSADLNVGPSISESLGNTLTNKATLAPLALAAVTGMGGMDAPQVEPEETPKYAETNPYFGNPLARNYLGGNTSERYGRDSGERTYFDPNRLNMAEGGSTGYLDGDTGGQEDKIPALLSDGEYVIDAATVALLGGGNNAAGAKKLDGLRKAIRMHTMGSDEQPKPMKDSVLEKAAGLKRGGLARFFGGGSADGDDDTAADKADRDFGRDLEAAGGGLGALERADRDLADARDDFYSDENIAARSRLEDSLSNEGYDWGVKFGPKTPGLFDDPAGWGQIRANRFLDNPLGNVLDFGLGLVQTTNPIGALALAANKISGLGGGPTIGDLVGGKIDFTQGGTRNVAYDYPSDVEDRFGAGNPYIMGT